MSFLARGLVVHGGDRGLELVRAERRRLQRVRDERNALFDERLVPEGAVLLGEWDQRAVGAGTRRAPRVGEQHEREEPGHLAVVGEQAADFAGEADGFTREIRTLQIGARRRGVALVEDQVQHLQHDAQPVGELRCRWHRERDCRRS